MTATVHYIPIIPPRNSGNGPIAAGEMTPEDIEKSRNMFKILGIIGGSLVGCLLLYFAYRFHQSKETSKRRFNWTSARRVNRPF